MKNTKLILLITTLAFALLPIASKASNTDVVINEVAAYLPSGHEWVEIYNKGSESVDLKNWKFWEDQTNHNLIPYCQSGACPSIIPAGAYAIVAQDPKLFLGDNPGFSGIIFDSSWGALVEKGEEIGLKDDKGIFVEKFTYLAIKKYSLERNNFNLNDYNAANWHENATGNTAGKVNSDASAIIDTQTTNSATNDTTNTATSNTTNTSNTQTLETLAASNASSTVFINEVYPNPAGADGAEEFIELKNNSDEKVNVTGWKISNLRSSVALWGSIEPRGFWTLGRNLTKLALGNTGDTIKLYNVAEKVADEVSYKQAKLGQSYNRTDGADWAWSAVVTRDEPNFIVESDAGGIGWQIAAPKLTEPGEVVEFNAEESADPRGGELTFSWDFGDGIKLFGEAVSHVFASSGLYNILVVASSTAGTAEVKKLSLTAINGLAAARKNIMITEILPNPLGQDDSEFIKIFNQGTTTVNLNGWQLKHTNTKPFVILEKTKILPGQYLTFYRSVTRLALDNKQDTVELLGPDNKIVNSVTYADAVENERYLLINGAWRWTGTIKKPVINTKKVSKPKITKPKKSAVLINAKNISPASTKFNGVATLADAREQPVKTWLTVTGTIMVLPGMFGKQYFYLGDETGGLQIYLSKKNFPDLQLGILAKAKGQLTLYNGIPRLNIKQPENLIVLSSTTFALEPKEVTTEDLDEAMAGSLVTLTGEITQLNSSLAYLDDGQDEIVAAFKPLAKINKSQLKVGNKARVSGVLEQTKTGWQIWPRGQGDIYVINTPTETNTTPSNNKILSYGIVTVAGTALTSSAVWWRKRKIKYVAKRKRKI